MLEDGSFLSPHYALSNVLHMDLFLVIILYHGNQRWFNLYETLYIGTLYMGFYKMLQQILVRYLLNWSKNIFPKMINYTKPSTPIPLNWAIAACLTRRRDLCIIEKYIIARTNQKIFRTNEQKPSRNAGIETNLLLGT